MIEAFVAMRLSRLWRSCRSLRRPKLLTASGFWNSSTGKMLTLQLTLTQDFKLQRLNYAIQYFQSMDQRLQAWIPIYTAYGQVVD